MQIFCEQNGKNSGGREQRWVSGLTNTHRLNPSEQFFGAVDPGKTVSFKKLQPQGEYSPRLWKLSVFKAPVKLKPRLTYLNHHQLIHSCAKAHSARKGVFLRVVSDIPRPTCGILIAASQNYRPRIPNSNHAIGTLYVAKPPHASFSASKPKP